MIYRLNDLSELNTATIKKIIEQFKLNDLPRLMKLESYYLNRTDILKRVQADPTKPNNRIVHPYAQYITDTLTGYFMGEPVSYSSQDDIAPLRFVFQYNDEQDENMELAKDASIYGRAFEYIYIDAEGKERFRNMDAKEIIPIYGRTIEDELLAVIRFYTEIDLTAAVTNQEFVMVEVYTNDTIFTYKCDSTLANLNLIDTKSHSIGCVPFVEYRNNDDLTGDFEGVMSLIDAYDILTSDDLNDFEYFCDAYLALYGYTADAEDVKAMKENRVLLMDENTKAEWLVKTGDSAGIEQEKSRIEKDIHKFSKTPNSSDESFSGNTSGVAMKYKLLGTENLASIKERKFKKGLQRRIEILCNVLSLLNKGNIDWLGIDVVFTRNLPVNETDITNLVSGLSGVVSRKTLLGQIPFVEDVENELEQLAQEQSSKLAYAAPVNSIAQSLLNKNKEVE